MMMAINLLPEDQRSDPDQWRRNTGIFLFLWLLMAAVLGGIYFFQAKQIKSVTTQSNQIRNEIQQYSQIQRSLAENEKKVTAIDQKIAIVNRFNQDRARPVALLSEVANRVLEDTIWLTKLEATPEMLTLSGYSMDERSVAALMTVMEKYDDYPVVTLKSLKQEMFNDTQPLMAFELVSRPKMQTAVGSNQPKQ